MFNVQRNGIRLGVLAVCLMLGLSLEGAIVEKIAVLPEKADVGYVPESLSQRVYHIIRTSVGSEFSEKILNDDIKELMLCGSFDNVRVERVDLGGDKLGLNFFVQPKPVVQGIVFRGNKEYKDSKLLIQVEDNLVIGAPLEERNKAAARKAVLDKYQDAGYYGTEVTTIEEKTKDGHGVNVVFVIKEEERYKLKGTFFENATAFEESDLRSTLYTKRQWWRYIFRFGNYFNKMLLPLDKDALKKKYHNAGYLDFQVVDVRQDLDEHRKWTSVTYVLEEGKPYTVTGLNLVGNKKFTSEQLLRLVTTKTGMTYNAERERLDTDMLKGAYGILGYLDVNVYAVHKKNTEAHTVSVEYHIVEGEVITIRDIKIVGNDLTREKVIRRELAIHPDDLGDPMKIELSKNRLKNLGYFSSVEILPAVTERPDQRDLRISLEEKPTGNVSLGAAFSTEDSVLGQFEFTETNFDLQRLLGMEWPPKGAGQRFRSRIQIGSDVSNATLSLDEPWFLDRRLNLGTEIFLRNRYEDEYDQRNIGMQVMLTWGFAFKVPFTNHIERGWRMGVGIRLEYVDISDCDTYSDTPEDYADIRGDFVRDRVIADEEDGYIANRLILQLTRDSRDMFRFPTRGSLLEFRTEYVTSALGSYEDYMRFNVGGSTYFPIGGGRVLKLALGASASTNDDKIAIFDRYFGGGVGTIRGFKRRDVAPVDCHEDPFGGNTMVTGTVEVFQPIKDFMYASVFADCGNVWYEGFDFSGDLCASVGVGVQFKALPVSLYYGIPVAEGYDHLEGKSGRFHFNIGFSY